MNSTSTTFNISDALGILIQGWNRYAADYDPNVLMNGMGICLALTGHNESHFMDEEIHFVNMYIDECTNVFSDDPGGNYAY